MKEIIVYKFATLHPLLLLSGVLVLNIFYVFTATSDAHIAFIFMLFLWLATVIYYIHWPFAVCMFLSKNIKLTSKKIIVIRILFIAEIVIMLFLMMVALIDNYLLDIDGVVDITNITIMPLFGFIIIYIYFRSSWLAAKFLLQSERGKNIGAGEVFATMLLFIYWPIGVFFLHGRLKRLE